MTEPMTEAEIVASMVGRTIEAAEYDPGPDGEWNCGEAATLTLDDGRKVCFGGYGLHTDGGVTIDIKDPR